jgi:serine/threonine protein kinase
MAGTCLGSPSYVAPERLLERPADGRADLYAVGVLLYELTAGRPPFVGTEPLDIARQHIVTQVPPLADLEPAAPAVLCATIHRALEKQPEQRFPRAELMAAALEGARQDLGADEDPGDGEGDAAATGEWTDASDTIQ